MKERHKTYIKINIVSLILVAVSFISLTFAWFGYTGLSSLSTEIDVKAWHIELTKNGDIVSNNISISFSELYPGMDTITEEITIKNLGDSTASVSYEIVSARILGDSKDNYIVDYTNVTSSYVEDKIAHEYPFKINVSLKDNIVYTGGDETTFVVSISWPMDSDNDELDTLWGSKANAFNIAEKEKLNADPSYQIRSSIQVSLKLSAEQYIEEDDALDVHYQFAKSLLYDIEEGKKCSSISSTCIKTYVIDEYNKVSDTTVTLLPDPLNTYTTSTFTDYSSAYNSLVSTWNVTTRELLVNDILNIISRDIIDTKLIRENLSDSIVGTINNSDRLTNELNKVISYNGYHKFLSVSFPFLKSANCFWTNTEYNTENAFAISKIDDSYSKLYGELKTNTCKIVPVIIAEKEKLNDNGL